MIAYFVHAKNSNKFALIRINTWIWFQLWLQGEYDQSVPSATGTSEVRHGPTDRSLRRRSAPALTITPLSATPARTTRSPAPESGVRHERLEPDVRDDGVRHWQVQPSHISGHVYLFPAHVLDYLPTSEWRRSWRSSLLESGLRNDLGYPNKMQGKEKEERSNSFRFVVHNQQLDSINETKIQIRGFENVFFVFSLFRPFWEKVFYTYDVCRA